MIYTTKAVRSVLIKPRSPPASLSLKGQVTEQATVKWLIGPLLDSVTWYGINYAGMQITQQDFQNKGTLTSPARLSFVLKVPRRYLRPSIIYSVPCDQIMQKAYFLANVLWSWNSRSNKVSFFQKIQDVYTTIKKKNEYIISAHGISY